MHRGTVFDGVRGYGKSAWYLKKRQVGEVVVIFPLPDWGPAGGGGGVILEKLQGQHDTEKDDGDHGHEFYEDV